jgi:hypothetical protein
MRAVLHHDALFEDVLSVARCAHAATAGWRTICVRAQRTVGKAIVQAIAELDLDGELPALSARVREILRGAPADIDTLVFGLFDGIEAHPAEAFTGFHLRATAGFDAANRWLRAEPTWQPEDAFLVSRSLDALAAAALTARGEARNAVKYTLRFGAAALLSRFASRGLPYRIVVAFDDGDFAEVTEAASAPRSTSAPRALLTRV